MATDTLTAPGTAGRRDGRARRLGKHALLVGFGLVMLYPLLWMVSSSFKPTEIIFRDPSIWPTEIDFSNYTEGWTALTHPFHYYMWNSAVIAILSVAGNLLSCSLAAYAFARLRFRGRNFFFAIMLSTLMLPIHVLIVPQYVLFSQLDWINTILPLVVPKFLAHDAFFIFLMVQFIRGLPRELDEAARIDGCGHFRIYWRIILPLSRLLQPAHLPHRSGPVHDADRAALVPRRAGRDRVGSALRDVDRRAGADLRLLHRWSALPDSGHRHHRA